MAHDQSIYPINDGICIPFLVAIDFTIMFGAFPIYVIAPITTELIEIAVKTFG